MAVAGSLRVDLFAGTRKFEQDMNRAKSTVNGFGKGVSRSGQSGKRFNQRMVEGSRAIDDISAGFATAGLNAQGFSLALRGAQNNVTTMLAVSSPLAAAIAGVGFAAGAILVKGIANAGKELDKFAEKSKTLKDTLDGVFDAIQRNRFAQGLRLSAVGVDRQSVDPDSVLGTLLKERAKLVAEEFNLAKRQVEAAKLVRKIRDDERRAGNKVGPARSTEALGPFKQLIQTQFGFGAGGAEEAFRVARSQRSTNLVEQGRIDVKVKQLFDAGGGLGRAVEDVGISLSVRAKNLATSLGEMISGSSKTFRAQAVDEMATAGVLFAKGLGKALVGPLANNAAVALRAASPFNLLTLKNAFTGKGGPLGGPRTDRFAAAISTTSSGARSANERGKTAFKGQAAAQDTAKNTGKLVDIAGKTLEAVRNNLITVFAPVG